MGHTLHAEIDDALAQAKGSEEKAKRAMVDAARLADELRAEQDHTAALGKGKAALTATMAELELNLGAANEVAAKGGRSAMAKLENRIHELEIELGAISAKTGETMKAFHRAERHVKELSFQGEQDKKNQGSRSCSSCLRIETFVRNHHSMILTEKWDLLQEKNSLTWKKILLFRPKMRT